MHRILFMFYYLPCFIAKRALKSYNEDYKLTNTDVGFFTAI